jgi:hypothetical protein
MVKRVVLILCVVMGTLVVGAQVMNAGMAGLAPNKVTLQDSSLTGQAATPRSLSCAHLLAPPVVDGKFDDWPAGLDGIHVNRDTAYSFSGRIDGYTDLSATVRSGWTIDALYFAIQISDDVVVTDSSDVWRDDGVEIGTDGMRDRQAWGLDDHQYTVVADGRITDRGVPTSSITATVLQRMGGYDVEIAIPMSKLITGVPISGTVMGFTIGVHDDDDGGNWDAYLIWEGTNTSSTPEQFGSLVLLERAEDRIAALEAKISQLEAKVQELLAILSEFQQVTPP